MSQRISLTRIVALNWYGFRQIIDVEDNILISGTYGTGKSALLDLIQYVMLCDGWRANRAAAGSARGRDLVGYCLGDTNTTRGNGERHFLRSNGVTLIALEFTRPSDDSAMKPERQTWGIRIEYSSPQANPKRTWFGIPARIDYADILAKDDTNAKDGAMLDDDEFKKWIRREYGPEHLHSSANQYLAEMATPRHLYFDLAAFRRTFPKAIAFEIEDNVEKFIRDFILEQSPLDVRDVRNALSAYEEVRDRLTRQEDEANRLRTICEHHTAVATCIRQAAVLAHSTITLKHQQATEALTLARQQFRSADQANQQALQELAQKRIEAEQLTVQLNTSRAEIQGDAAATELEKLDVRKNAIEPQILELRNARQTAAQRFTNTHKRWLQWFRHAEKISNADVQILLAKLDLGLIEKLHVAPTEALRAAALTSLAETFNGILWPEATGIIKPLGDQIKTYDVILERLKIELANLDHKQTPGAFPVYQALRKKIGPRVHQLARLVEVNHDADPWWPVLEACLGHHRWTLILDDPDDYEAALDILRTTKPGTEPEYLLNPREALQLPAPETKAGTLRGKVTATHPLASTFLNRLLGDITCANPDANLELADVSSRALTLQGHQKDQPLRVRLRLDEEQFTLGEKGIERMRQVRLKTQRDTQARRAEIAQQKTDLEAWLHDGRSRDAQHGISLGDAAHPPRLDDLPRLAELESELGTIKSTIDFINTPEIQERLKRLHELSEAAQTLTKAIGVLENQTSTYSVTTVSRLREAVENAESAEQQAHTTLDVSRLKLNTTFPDITSEELVKCHNDIHSRFTNWAERINYSNTQSSSQCNQAELSRKDRNTARHALHSDRDEEGHLRHPSYSSEFGESAIAADDNTAYAARLTALETIALEKSRKEATDRQKDWENRLEKSVFKGLQTRLEAAENTIKLLKRHLRQPVGKYRYSITARRDPACAAAWHLIDTGFNKDDPLTAAIQEQDIQQARQEIMEAIKETSEGNERAKRLLDYRNYHHYDIVMTPIDRPGARPISIGHSGRNLSGGENQAPFFISMLAAFRRVYDRGNHQSADTQHLGLVVMDEAFSKLSGDGIEDCLELAHSFRLQLVMAFPPERLGVMVPYAQSVVVCRKEIEYDAKGEHPSRIDNIPMVMTINEAIDAIE